MTSGGISLAEEYLKASLAASSHFQALVEAENAEAALESIHNDGLPPPAAADGRYTKTELVGYHPYGIVATDPERGYATRFSAIGSTGGHEYVDAGSLVLVLARIVPAEETAIATAERAWKDVVGPILADLWAVAGLAGYLAVTAIELAELARYHPDDEPEMGDAQQATLLVDWGVES